MSDIIWTPGITLDQLEKQAILKAFRHYHGNKTTTANALGISIRTLDHKLEKYAEEQKQEDDRQYHDKIKRSELLLKARGQLPNNIVGETTGLLRPSPGVHMESVVKATTQQTMPLSVGEQVQEMLSKQVSSSHPRKRS